VADVSIDAQRIIKKWVANFFAKCRPPLEQIFEVSLAEDLQILAACLYVGTSDIEL